MIQTVITQCGIERSIELIRENLNKLDEIGCAFVIVSTEYDVRGNVIHDFFEVISAAVRIGYEYVNTIVYPTKNLRQACFCDNTKYIVWLCKNQEKMLFNKDAIREKHIWKDVEWGKRAKNYNPKGKDPGNVWIPTVDDGNATITEHILLSEDEVVQRLLAMSNCGNNYIVYKNETTICDICTDEVIIDDTKQEREACGRVIFGTSECMDQIQNGSVGVIITSPPYWNLKDYFKEGQIGQESYSDYLNRMRAVWKECFDKLKDTGSLWININIRIRNKEVILIPYDFIEICKKIGFYYKGIFIWHKSSGIPTGNKNIVDRHEYVLVFSKQDKFKMNSVIQHSFSDYKNNFIGGGTFWNINRKAGSVGKKYIHPAIYPNELVRRIVLLTTNEGDIVADPFLGSGTSLIASLQCNRNFVGYEYNEGFKELMDSRFKKELDGKMKVEYYEQINI